MTSRVLTAIAAAPGENVAVRDGQRSMSYAALTEALHAESRWLHEHAVERCALLADNGVGWIIADLALLRAGALNVPLPGWFTVAQISHVIADAGVESILTDAPVRMPTEFQLIGVAPELGGRST